MIHSVKLSINFSKLSIYAFFDRLVRINRGKYVIKTAHKLLVTMRVCFFLFLSYSWF